MTGSDTVYTRRTMAPYGPVKGMLEGLELLRRTSPAVVDEEFLKSNHVAPNNEYKVVGALRFLGLVDETGRPTEKSRLLKTRGGPFALNLQNIIRDSYGDLFAKVNVRQAGPDDIHSYFVADLGMGAEMANKATRFFVELCRLAELELGTSARKPAPSRRAGTAEGRGSGLRPVEEPVGAAPARAMAGFPMGVTVVSGPAFPLVVAVTLEVAQMGEDELVEVLRKLQRAARRVLLEGN